MLLFPLCFVILFLFLLLLLLPRLVAISASAIRSTLKVLVEIVTRNVAKKESSLFCHSLEQQ